IPAPFASKASKRDQAGTHAPCRLLSFPWRTRPIGRPAQNFTRLFVEEIEPLGVHALDKPDLPQALPLLNLFLAPDRLGHRLVHLVVDRTVHLVVFGESLDQTLLVLGHPPEEIARDTSIERAIA